MPNKIVMISGKQGSGKTTLQMELQNRWPGDTMNVNFADVLYRMHDAVLDVLHCYWPPRDIKKDGPLLQLLGTDWGRKIDQNIWIKILRKKIESYDLKNGLIIVGDCRFQNELDGIPEALRVRLECDRETRKARCSMWRDNEAHPSEVDLDDYVYVPGKFDLLFNSGAQSVEHCATMILAQLDKNVWTEKRK